MQVSQKDAVMHEEFIRKGWKSSDHATCNYYRDHLHSTRNQHLSIMLNTINSNVLIMFCNLFILIIQFYGKCMLKTA